MKTVWKYECPVQDRFELQIPEGSELLHIESQHDTPCMWFRVGSYAAKQCCTFLMRGTGHDCSDTGKHLGSVQLSGGAPKLSEHIRSNGVSPSALTEEDFWTIVECAAAHGMAREYIHTSNVDDDVAS